MQPTKQQRHFEQTLALFIAAIFSETQSLPSEKDVLPKGRAFQHLLEDLSYRKETKLSFKATELTIKLQPKIFLLQAEIPMVKGVMDFRIKALVPHFNSMTPQEAGALSDELGKVSKAALQLSYLPIASDFVWPAFEPGTGPVQTIQDLLVSWIGRTFETKWRVEDAVKESVCPLPLDPGKRESFIRHVVYACEQVGLLAST